MFQTCRMAYARGRADNDGGKPIGHCPYSDVGRALSWRAGWVTVAADVVAEAEKTVSRSYNAYCAGRLARLEGWQLVDNPHQPHATLHHLWEAGWIAQHVDVTEPLQ